MTFLSNSIYPAWPAYSEEEAEAVKQVLLSGKVNYWTGTETREFECEFAGFTNSRYAIAVANGTVALDLALKAFNIGPGDEVIVTPRSYIASVSSVILAGATPVFVDVDEDSQNIEASVIADAISSRTRAVIVVHLAGMPADMDPIMGLAAQHDFKVIEDCAQAHGATYKGRSVGSIGHIGTWSFCQDKIITTGGEGGMVTTNDEALWQLMWSYKDHGKSWDAVYNREHEPGFRWVNESFGTNWRMTELQGVLGRIQLKKMSEWTTQRRDNAHKILSFCRNISWLRVPDENEISAERTYYRAYVFVRPERLPVGWTRSSVLQALCDCGVSTNSGSCPEVYKERAFQNTKYGPKQDLPMAKKLGETSLVFLVHPTLNKEHIDQICRAISQVDETVKNSDK